MEAPSLHEVSEAGLVPYDEAADTAAASADSNSLPGRENVDTFEHNYNLERVSRASDHLLRLYAPPDIEPGELRLQTLTGKRHSAERIGNQFGAKVVRAFLLDDPERAYERLSDLRPTTPGQEMVTLINEAEFGEAHRTLHRIMRLEDDDVRETVQRRLRPGGSIERTDYDQFYGEADASLDEVRERGITLQVPGSTVADIAYLVMQAGDGPVPATEIIKNKKAALISGFNGSKISLLVHDTIDHMWTFDLAERTGLIDKFGDFFDRVGNPQERNIFRREGEMVASIAFGVRYFKAMESGLVSVISSERIERILRDRQERGELDERHERAIELLGDMHMDKRGIRRPSMEAQSLSFVFSNYICELNEQRRKHGKIKDMQDGQIVGELNPFDSDYLALFVELHHELLQPKHKHRDFLAKTHLILEEFLIDLADERIESPYELNLTLDKVNHFDPATSKLPRQRVQWMLSNYGFTADRRDAI